jgi:hypothetical protein
MKFCAIFLGLISALAACSSKVTPPDPYATKTGFCEGWAEAACSVTVVSHCSGVEAAKVTPDLTSACVDTQKHFCEGLVPDGYVSTQAEICLSAVRTAYSDGTLSASEVATVRHLGEPCNHLIKGSQAKDDSCTTDTDCNTVDNYLCVMKSGVGACEIPKLVDNGTSCSAPEAACHDGFYCDGAHCVQSLDKGEKCKNDFECTTGLSCDATSGTCAPRVPQTSCTMDQDCTTNVCDLPVGKCVSSIILSPAEGLCQDLQ